MITHTKFLYKDLSGFFAIYNGIHRAPASLSSEARKRLKWFDYYHKTKDVSLTCRHFDISRKTFYYWKRRYNPRLLTTLESHASVPKKKRQPQITSEQESRIVALRSEHMSYGKEKLARWTPSFRQR